MNRRVQACYFGKINFRFVGTCQTEQNTVAYVKPYYWWVLQTINICDEFFDRAPSYQFSVLLHEFGRLENIGDSPNVDTNSISVWDTIVGRLGEESTLEAMIGLASRVEILRSFRPQDTAPSLSRQHLIT